MQAVDFRAGQNFVEAQLELTAMKRIARASFAGLLLVSVSLATEAVEFAVVRL